MRFDFDTAAYPPLPAMRGLFVTGTDTEVGKTIIAGAIALHLRRAGKAVEVFKPVATGCRRSRSALLSADAEFLAACADSKRTLSEISPLCYSAAVAPNVAARREGKTVDLDAIFDAYKHLSAEHAGAVIVEGIGGLLCPISDEFWVIHLAKMMRLPVVLVVRAGLGTINHTLLTLHAAGSAGLNVVGVVINRYPIEAAAIEAQGPNQRAADLATLTNPDQIAHLGRVPVLAIVPDEPDNSVQEATIGPDTQFAIDQVPWEKIIRIGD